MEVKRLRTQGEKDIFDNPKPRWLEYLHDNSQKAGLKITPLGFKDGFYRIELGFTDPTDYARLLDFTLEQLHLK